MQNTSFKWFLGLIFLLNCSLSACRKHDFNSDLHTTANIQEAINLLDDADKVHSSDITLWLKGHESILKPMVQLKDLSQNIIKNHHVVRVPIGTNAALFFTKDAGTLKIWAYKWFDEKPGAKIFSGQIASYSFQSNNAALFSFDNGRLSKQQSITGDNNHNSNNLNNKQTSSGFSNFLFKVMCWIRGGDLEERPGVIICWLPASDQEDDNDDGGSEGNDPGLGLPSGVWFGPSPNESLNPIGGAGSGYYDPANNNIGTYTPPYQSTTKNASGIPVKAIVHYYVYADHIWDSDENKYMGVVKLAEFTEELDLINKTSTKITKTWM